MPHYLLAATFLFAAQSMRPAEDFAFRFESFDCPIGLIDTFNGTYRRRIAGRVSGGGPTDVSIPLVLNSDQRSEIFEAVIKTRFFDMPDVVNPRVKPDANVRLGNYLLEIRNAGRQHAIWWMDPSWSPKVSPITDEEQRRNELMSTILRVVDAHPLVRRLPAPMGGCE